MNFAESEAYLYSLGNEVEAMKLGLDSIRKLLKALGNPEKNYLKVQVAGTNGKGSVCAFLNSICLEAGIKTGMFTSPHLVSVTERVKIDGVDINEDAFAHYATRIRQTSERLVADGEIENVPTFFEQVTAITLLAFREAKVDLALLETGLGGRFDAVTEANAEVCAITRIDYDHQEQLGETIEEIAAEKAAVIHARSTVIVGDQKPQVMNVIMEVCRSNGIEPVLDCEADYWAIDTISHSVDAVFRTPREVYSDANLGLKGRHQLENARVAVMLAESMRFDYGLPISVDNVLDGLKSAKHPGRLEWIGNFLLDGAHNVSGAKALLDYLDEFVEKPITLIFAAMRDKNVNEIATILWPRAERIILTSPQNPRALSADALADMRPKKYEEARIIRTNSVLEAIEIAMSKANRGETILTTGSLYLVGEARKLLTREGK